jgi:phage I-like protein
MGKLLFALKEVAGAPGEFQLLPEGRIEIAGEPPAYIDQAAAEGVIRHFKSRGNDMVIDYEHQTLSDKQAPAAGWIRELIWKGQEGLWAIVEWTKKAREYLENREYRYFSPVMWVGQEDRKVKAVVNVALTNSPAMNNIRPIVAKSLDWERIEGLFPENEKEANMIEKLRKILGLPADAGEDRVLEAVTLSVNRNATMVACREVLDALGAKAEAGRDEVVQLVASLKAPGDAAVALSRQVTELTAKIARMEQDDLVSLALKEGKTSPEELDKWGRDLALKNPESFKLIVLSRPAGSVIPVDQIVVAKDRTGGALDSDQKKINEMCGVTDEAFTKYNR